MPLVIDQKDLDRLPITIDLEIVTCEQAIQVLEFLKAAFLKLRKIS